jgi:hypothetical protein
VQQLDDDFFVKERTAIAAEPALGGQGDLLSLVFARIRPGCRFD